MRYLPVTIKDKIAEYMSSEKMICYNSDYILQFTFDAEWDSYIQKTAQIRYFSTNKGWVKHDIIFTGLECNVPVIPNASVVYVGVYAGDIRTTTEAEITCRPSVLSYDGAPANPPDDVYNQIMQKLNELEQSGATPEQIAAAVEQYLTENPVTGEKGDPGEKGEPGADGKSAYEYAQDGGYTGTEEEFSAKLAAEIPIVDDTLTIPGEAADAAVVGQKLTEQSDKIAAIPSGKDGVGLQSVVQTTTSAEDGGTNVVTVTKTDGSSSTFTVKNGSKGSDGAPGTDGAPGVDGHTPVKGTDYFTDAEKQEIAEDAAALVDLSGKQNKITASGILKGDASGGVTAAEAGVDYAAPSLGLTGAAVGQAPMVKTIDEQGNPTEWEPVTLAKADGSNIPNVPGVMDAWRTRIAALPGTKVYGKADANGKIKAYIDAACTEEASVNTTMELSEYGNAMLIYDHKTYQCVGFEEPASVPGFYIVSVFSRSEIATDSASAVLKVETAKLNIADYLSGDINAPIKITAGELPLTTTTTT